MNKKRFLTLLLAGVLSLGLTACSGGDERGSSSTGDQSSSSTAEEPSSGTENSSKVEGFTLDTPTTADEAAEYFKQALLAGNVDAIQKVTSCIYEDWDDVTFDSIEYQTIAQDPVSSRYQFTFTVSQSDCETFPTGTYERIVEVTNVTDYSETPVVTMLYDKSWNYYELFPYDMEQPGYDVYSQMKRFVDFMGNMTFSSPSELTEEQMVEYAMVTIFDDYNGERELYSVDEVSKMVETLFGVSGVDASKTKFYNEEEGGCEMLGRGGMWYYTWTSPAVQDASTGRYTLDITFYSDPLRTIKEKSMRYTLEPNGDHYKFISAVEI